MLLNKFLSQNPVINYIKDTEILLFIICLLLSFISAFIIDKIFILIFKNIVKKTKTDIDDKLINVIHPAVYKTILYIGFYFALETIIFPEKIEFVLKGLIKSMIVIHWSLTIFKSFRVIINWASNQDNDKRLLKKKTIPIFDN